MSLFGCAKRDRSKACVASAGWRSRPPRQQQTHTRSNGRQRNGVLNYLFRRGGFGLASVAAKPQAATNRRCLAQEAFASRVNDRQACKRKPVCVERISAEGGERDAGIFVGDDGGRGVA